MRSPFLLLALPLVVGAGCSTPWREGAAADLAATADALEGRSQELSATVQQLYAARAMASQGPDAAVGEMYFAQWGAALFPDQALTTDAFERKLLELELSIEGYPTRAEQVERAAWGGSEASKKLAELTALSASVNATTQALGAYYGPTATAETTAALADQLTLLVQIETLRLQQALEESP